MSTIDDTFELLDCLLDRFDDLVHLAEFQFFLIGLLRRRGVLLLPPQRAALGRVVH